MKSDRGLSGIYFRYQNPETEKWGNRVFEDLPEEEQDRILDGRDKDYLKRLCKLLANTITRLGDDLDITLHPPDYVE